MTDLSTRLIAGELPDESTVHVGVNAAGLTYAVTQHAPVKPVANIHNDITKRMRLDTLEEPRGSGWSDAMDE